MVVEKIMQVFMDKFRDKILKREVVFAGIIYECKK